MQQLEQILDDKGGFVKALWDGTTETELAVKDKTKATIRCIDSENSLGSGDDIYSGQPSTQTVLYARSY